MSSSPNLRPSISSQDWDAIEHSLDDRGNAVLRGLLTPQECRLLSDLYSQERGFRSRVVMARHGFGKGEYKYFSYPLPPLLESLRCELYVKLVAIANRWNEHLRIEARYPSTLDAFLRHCHAAGQLRPTPLILRYGPGDYNCLHQDLYGAHVFPLQATILLSKPGEDFTGGEFVMRETGSKQQRADVVRLALGDAAIFAVNYRPERGARGRPRKVSMRHGVSQLLSGERHTVGLIFHDAQ